MADADPGEGGIDGRDDREAAVPESAHGERGIAGASVERELVKVEGHVGRPGGTDLKVVRAGGQVDIGRGIGVCQALDEGGIAVRRDVDGRASELRWTMRTWLSSALGAGSSTTTWGWMPPARLPVAATVVIVPPSNVSAASMTMGPSSRVAPLGTTWTLYSPPGTSR